MSLMSLSIKGKEEKEVRSMHSIFDYMTQHKHEKVYLATDSISGLQAVIALHNTVRGPAIGGVRLWQYDSEEAAIQDVLRLSEAMTFKAAVADIPFGGGKAVILADGKEQEPGIRAARLRAFGRFVESLSGCYIAGPDVGTSPADMAQIKEVTGHVVCCPVELGGSGDSAPMTAFGVLQGMRALAEEALGVRSLVGVRVAIQGLGNVGMNLARLLITVGAVVVGTDIRPEVVKQARMQLPIEIVVPEAIYDVSAAIFAPCALGGILNDRTIERLSCQIIAGAANNQLEDDRHAELLRQCGIVYGVDYVLNAGGLINAAQELEGYDQQKARQRVAHIYYTVKRMLAIAKEQQISTLSAARQMAAEVLQRPYTLGALCRA
jgi:leucine dehydrogenase